MKHGAGGGGNPSFASSIVPKPTAERSFQRPRGELSILNTQLSHIEIASVATDCGFAQAGKRPGTSSAVGEARRETKPCAVS